MGDNSLIPISDEQAKLVQEVLKTLQGLGSFFEKALGGVPEDLIGYLGGDWLRLRRAKNIAELLRRTKETLETLGVKDTKPASLTLALPILRDAADESREELRDLWARLLAAAMDPNKEKDIRQRFAETIKRMDPIDALVLAYLKNNNQKGLSTSSNNIITKEWKDYDTASTEMNVTRNELVLSLQNLEKIGLLDKPNFNVIIINIFGREFLRVIMD